MPYHERLGLDRSTFDDLLDRFERRSFDGREYRHLPDYRRNLERGTVLIEGDVVRGFPKVPRTLMLETGIPRHFDGELAVEEKLDGYNVRVVRLDGEPLAFTRGGIVCPYTTRLVASRLDLDPFFDDHPDRMLCGEVVGPENPYTAHDYPEVDSIAFRAFDVRDRETGEAVPVADRRALCDDFAVPQVRLFGTFGPDEAARAVPGIVRDLHDGDREGVVMKSTDGGNELKYTTSAANHGDLAYAFSLPFDYGQSFMFRRIVREAFQSVEWNEGDQAARRRARALGESILLSMIDAIRQIEAGGEVGERHTVRDDPAAVEALLAHLRDQGLELVVEDDRSDGDERVVTFTKRTQSTNDKIRAYLDGAIVTE